MARVLVAYVFISIVLQLCQREVHGMMKPSRDSHIGRFRIPNKTPVKTIQSEDGDVIDCVHIYDQPSLDHPSLNSHKIQMRPMVKTERHTVEEKRSRREIKQAWHRSGSCPKGTIPILRSQTLDERKKIVTPFARKSDQSASSSSDPVREFAAVLGKFEQDYGVFGAKALISVWNPRVLDEEFSMNMVGLGSGDTLQMEEYIMAGWIVYKNLYGDSQTRLFTFWQGANDSCFDIQCNGFVQVNPNVVLGGALPISTYGGNLSFIHVEISKDWKEDWWLLINNALVGYWPSSLFSFLNYWANSTSYGGEILNTKPGGYHTLTEMGNGHFASEGDSKACMVSNIHYANGDRKFKRLPDASIVQDRPECYSIDYFGERYLDKLGQLLYNGGPGLSVKCM